MKHKNKLTFGSNYSCNSARENYSYPENTLDDTVHGQESSNSNIWASYELNLSILDSAPGLIKSGLERFLCKYPNWRKWKKY